MTPNIDQVTRLLNAVARDEILPRFGSLGNREVESKVSVGDPDDIVTVVDRAVEARLGRELSVLMPSVPVIGEEACHEQPELLGALDGDAPLWLLDPIDGTKNFAWGGDRFGVMLAWVRGGRTEAAWILLPIHQQVFVAEAGSGTFRNGVRIQVPESKRQGPLRGTVLTRYMSPSSAEEVSRHLAARYMPAPMLGCAAMEYTAILAGDREFTIYHRLHPWDHAPGALILSEAGGTVQHLDGTRYGPRAIHQTTIVAGNERTAGTIRGWLSTVQNDR